MRPDELPEDVLEVNGFRRVRGSAGYVEWRDVGRDRVARVWITSDTPTGHAWLVHYELSHRGRGGVIDQGTVGEYDRFEAALPEAASFMRGHGTGRADTAGGLPDDFDFTGGRP